MAGKIQLVRCPVDDPSIAADQWNMPLDLLVVADAIDRRHEIEIVDGTLLGLDGVRKRLDPDASCVGFTYTALSSRSLAVLAAEAKANGACVIVGGQPATGASTSLIREEFIDAVCIGDGEPAMAALSRQLLRGEADLTSVPNLLVRNGNELARTRTEEVDILDRRIPTRSLGGLNPEDYISRYPSTNTLTNMGGRRALNLFSKRGCPRHCSFCARQDKKLRLRSPHLVVEELRTLSNLYGIDYFLDTSDTWVARGWGEAFAQARIEEECSSAKMMVFADVRDIDAQTAGTMVSCGIDSVLLGVESGSERILARNGKRIKRQLVVDAVDLLVQEGIRVSASFVVGLLGEDHESLEKTVSLAGVLHERPGVLCYGNIIMPLMGSWLWREAFPADRRWPSYITRALDYDLRQVRELYVATATSLTDGMDKLERACQRILATSGLPTMEYAR